MDRGAFRREPKASYEMTLRQELLTALKNGARHPALLEILQANQGEPGQSKSAYEVLEQIWRELGFDDSGEQSQTRTELECALEKTWYTTAATKA